MLAVPEYEEWVNFTVRDDHGCGGIGNCKFCNKKMYPKRGVYLKSWMITYSNNIKAIREGSVKMPKLLWLSSDTATLNNIIDFHKTKCNTNICITDCDCETAFLLKSLYSDPDEGYNKPSFIDIIYPTYLKWL
jgi:hypothetical protein